MPSRYQTGTTVRWRCLRTDEQLDAALLHSVAGNHALVDGNKRLAWFSTVVFLDINGHGPASTADAAFTLVMDVAARDLTVAEIARRLAVSPA